MLNIVFSSTTQLAAAIRTRCVSAAETLKAHLAQIEQCNPALNAIHIMDAEKAMERAQAADEALARGEVWGPLHGVPFTLKDVHSTAGMRTTVGFPNFADYVPKEDSTVTARLKQAGAVLIGKSNVPMLLADYQTNNPVFGRTNNPWNVNRTPGGSSGGAAAALASGMTPFDIGTDLSSSIRIPAHFCGVCGLKPTEARVPLTGLFPNPHGTPRSIRIMSSIGPMARTVEDLALLYSIIAGPDGRDTEVQPVPVEDVPELAVKNQRIAFVSTFPGFPVQADIRTGLEELAQQLDRAGAAIEEAALPELEYYQELASGGKLIGMMIGAFQHDARERPSTLPEYMESLHRRDRSIFLWEQFFQKWDALLCPASMVTAFPHCEPGTPLRVDGREVEYRMLSAHGALFNYTGHPAVVLPYKLDQEGLPIGVQLVGKRWNESHLLATAMGLAPLTGEFRRPPGF
jgi:amidase